MTKEEINVILAEYEGWKMYYQLAIDQDWKSKNNWITNPEGEPLGKSHIPNYYDNLNLLHNIENKLSNKQWNIYVNFVDDEFGFHEVSYNNNKNFYKFMLSLPAKVKSLLLSKTIKECKA